MTETMKPIKLQNEWNLKNHLWNYEAYETVKPMIGFVGFKG